MKRLFSISLVGILLSAVTAWPVAASTKVEKDIQFSQKVKAGVARIGTGPEARVEVKLRDKSKLNGFIQEASESSFVVNDLKTGAAMTVAYADVKQIKGNNLSTGAKIAIGVGIGIGVLIIIALIAAHSWGD